jgi:cytochrome P450 family 9
MRQMFEFMSSVGQQTVETLKRNIESGGESSFEFKAFSKKFTVDVSFSLILFVLVDFFLTFLQLTVKVIATCAYGIEINSFENPKNDFYQIATKFVNFDSFWLSIKFAGYLVIPKIMNAFKVKLFDPRITDFFRKTITETMKVREEKGIVRKDMIHLLMEAKKGKLTYEKEKEEKIVDGFATVEESEVGRSEVKRKWEDDDLTAQW